MRIATWNVNSVRARLHQVGPWLDEHAPDVLCLQETKVEDHLFPREPFTERGYHLSIFGQKSYNGVAIASKAAPVDVSTGLPGDGPDDQKRVIEATVDGVRVINLYVPNGHDIGTDKYAFKLDWLKRLRAHLDESRSTDEEVVVLGDMNITPEDKDVYDPVGLKGKIHLSEPERDALKELMAFGLKDAHRLRTLKSGVYTWWDFRGAMFDRGQGYRIDLILVTAPMAKRLTNVTVDKVTRGGEKPSDHAPLIADFR